MRNLFIIIISLLIVGCAKRPSYSPRLLLIEQSARKNPPSTLQNLEDSKTFVKTKADSMLYVLLYSEEGRAMGMTFVNDGWISPAVNFFDSIGDINRAERSMYMLALCYYDDGKYDKTAEWLMKARDLNDKDNPSLRCQLYLALGDINKMVGRQDEMFDDYRNAYDAAVTANDKEKQVMVLYQQSISYFDLSEKDSLSAIASRLKAITKKSDNCKTMAQTVDGMQYLLSKDTTAAYSSFSNALSNDVDYRASYLLGEILYNKGNKDEACNMWLIAANSTDRSIAINATSRLVDNVESMPLKLSLSQSLNRLYAEKPTPETTAKVIDVQNQFNEMAKDEQTHHKIVVLSVAVGALFLFIVIIGLVIIRRGRKQKLEEQAWDIERELLNSEIVQDLHSLVSKGKTIDADGLRELDELISSKDQHLSALFRKDRNLSTVDRHVAQLIRLRFQPSEIAVLLDLSPQRVTNARSRLLLRFFGVKGGAKEFDKRIRDL